MVDWNYSGKADFLLGTSATRAEKILGWSAGLVGAGLYVWLYMTRALDWAWWQYIVAGLLAFDVAGGVVANALNSCKQFYHTPPKPDEPPYAAFFKNHLFFTLLHIHPLAIALLFGSSNYFFGIFWYLYLIAGTIVITGTPLYIRRPVAFFGILLALLLNIYVIAPVPGFEWFVPALMMKILYGHLVREEPYRPMTEV